MNIPYKTTPLAHQLQALEKLKDLPYFALFCDMGTGKSKMAIDLINYKFLKGETTSVVYVAPIFGLEQFMFEQLDTHSGLPVVRFVYKTNQTKRYLEQFNAFLHACNAPNLKGPSWLGVHIDALSHTKVFDTLNKFVTPGTAFLIDEGTSIKNSRSKRAKNTIKFAHAKCNVRGILTGTPTAKRPLDVWNMYRFLDPSIIGVSETAFKAKYAVLSSVKVKQRTGREISVDCVLTQELWARVKKRLKNTPHPLDYDTLGILSRTYKISPQDILHIDAHDEFIPYKNIAALRKQVDFCTFAVSKKDCLDLPDKQYKVITLEPPAEYKKLISAMCLNALAFNGDKYLTIPHKAALETRVRQVCGGNFPYVANEADVSKDVKPEYASKPIEGPNPKLNALLQLLDEIGDQVCLIFAVFTAEINAIYNALVDDYSVVALSGQTPQEERNTIVEDFKAGKYQVAICNPAVAGRALNFQHAGVQIWYSRNWNIEDRIQAEDRSHRIGITKSPLYIDLVYALKHEQRVLDGIKRGKDLNEFFRTGTIEDFMEF